MIHPLLPDGALRPRATPMRLHDVTVFLITTGEATTRAARACIDTQVSPAVQVITIDHVAPMDRAFQAMLDRCQTRYYVQVDADMLLHPDAVGALHEAITTKHKGAAMVCAPLWDVFDDRPIYGVKIYDHAITARFPYQESLSCEVHQMARMEAAGHRWSLIPLAERPVCYGLHGTQYTPREAFLRYRGLAWKQRRSLVTHPPLGQILWIEPYHQRHIEAWRKTGDPVRLAAAMGLMAGITEPLPPLREDDYRASDATWDELEARYFKPRDLPKWVENWRG